MCDGCKNKSRHFEWLCLFCKSLLVGASMLLPGLSGGTIALTLGIYHKLLNSFSGLFSDRSLFWGRACVLSTAFVGGAAGVFLFARPIASLYGAFPVPMTLLFTVLILLGCRALLGEAGVSSLRECRWTDGVFVAAGMGMVAFLQGALGAGAIGSGTLGSGALGAGAQLSQLLAALPVLLLVGIVLAAALILPGISASHMLLTLGLYDRFLTAVALRDFVFLSILGTSVLIGMFATSGAISGALHRWPRTTNMVIIGFVVASAIQILTNTL